MVDWGKLLVAQLTFYWEVHLRPRLEGLTDQEYFWEPVPGCWTVRPGPDVRYVMDEQFPPPYPPPVTTIAWRMVHIGAECFAVRTSAYFGDLPDDVPDTDSRHRPTELPGTAADGIAFLERTYHEWRDNIAALSEAGVTAQLGPKAGPFGHEPMAGLILHINREVMHHGGEIGVLRDLYRAGFGG